MISSMILSNVLFLITNFVVLSYIYASFLVSNLNSRLLTSISFLKNKSTIGFDSFGLVVVVVVVVVVEDDCGDPKYLFDILAHLLFSKNSSSIKSVYFLTL
eukprot:TRINITY_DN7191_c0_g1_i1.p1 TRINITY_DN7191_c0_g1~~TRINITY_DN7191_c0_g1_i1.p1  ORF type:complete len:101 (+),score=11.85 TRINITY_DN7191_c0_g1_i1:282-584(+)